MKNTERYRHLRVDWVGQSITLCGVEGEDIGAGQALCPDCAQIGPRRQGYASPLRALDRCGSIWRDALFTREKWGSGRGARRGESRMIKDIIIHCGEAEREPFGHPRRLSRSRAALSLAGP